MRVNVHGGFNSSSMAPPTGLLALVVGPSGAGKDSLIDAARVALAADDRFVFARRLVTRPATAGGEIHTPIGEDEFEAGIARGRFLLHWRSHGLGYAIPVTYLDDLGHGRIVVANVSRTVIEIAEAIANVAVLHVTASPEMLASRIAKRGRETPKDVLGRLSRRVDIVTRRAPVLTISNDGALADAAADFVSALRSLAPSLPAGNGR